MTRAAALTLLLWAAAGVGAAGAYDLPPQPDGAVRYEADSFEWDASTTTGAAGATMHLIGHVRVEDSSRTIRAGDLRLDMDSRRGYASRSFTLDDGQSVVAGQGGEYDFAAHEGTVFDARGEYPPWRIWAREAEVDESKIGTFRSSLFTSCDAGPPHYYFRASRVRISPKKWLYARNAVFYVDRVPVFYTPFLWKSLKPKHVIPTRVNPGYDHRNGAFLKTTTGYSIGEAMYGKLYLDYYGRHGPGYGNELQYRASPDARGALFGYRIRDKNTGTERWALLGSIYRVLPSSFSLQGRLQAQSDSSFNNDFQRSNSFRVAPDLTNSAALVHRGSWGTGRLVYSRFDVAGSTGSYVKQTEDLPRLEFQSKSFSLGKSPILYTINTYADDNYSQTRGYQQKSMGASIQGTRTKVLAPGLSVTPLVAYRENYYDRLDAPTDLSTQTYRDPFIGDYQAGFNLRYNTRLGAWDAGYTFDRRLKVRTFQDDAGAPDYGIQSSAATLQDTIRPTRSTLLRIGSGYDFRRFRNYDPGFRGRVIPFTADAVWTKGLWQLTAREQFTLAGSTAPAASGGSGTTVLQLDRGDRLGTFVGAGVAYNKIRANEMIASNEFGWAPGSSTWRVNGALRYVARSEGGNLSAFRIFEKELSIVKDFHDFHTRALFRIRPGGVKEAQIRLELRLGQAHGQKPAEKPRDWESEWFPWRKNEASD